MHGLMAARAYQARSADRNFRDQEADVFRRATAALRHAQNATDVDRIRALADNRVLWTSLINVLQDPDNRLPAGLKASIVSVGMTVQREIANKTPDFSFLIGVNEQMTAGLMGS